MRRATKLTGRWALSCGIMVGTIVAGIWLTYPRERLLTEITHPLIANDTSVCRPLRCEGDQGDPKETVYWLDANKLVILTGDHDDLHRPDDWHGRAELFDIRTHSRRRLIG